jgi:hypothetical protein
MSTGRVKCCKTIAVARALARLEEILCAAPFMQVEFQICLVQVLEALSMVALRLQTRDANRKICSNLRFAAQQMDAIAARTRISQWTMFGHNIIYLYQKSASKML